MSFANDVSYVATFVYGSNYVSARRTLWGDILSIASRFQHEAWVVLGDFNAIRFSHEKDGGSRKWPSHMNELDGCVVGSLLEDVAIGMRNQMGSDLIEARAKVDSFQKFLDTTTPDFDGSNHTWEFKISGPSVGGARREHCPQKVPYFVVEGRGS